MAANGEIDRVGRGQYALPTTPQTDHKDWKDWKEGTDGKDCPDLSDLSATHTQTDRSPVAKNTDKSGATVAKTADLSDLTAYNSPPLGPPGDSLDDFH